MKSTAKQHSQVVLITGAAKRIGAQLAEYFHQSGYHVIIHTRKSLDAAQILINRLNQQRADSATLAQADLASVSEITSMVESIRDKFGHLDGIINNASDFFATEIGKTSEADWDKCFASNLKGPFFLCQAAADLLLEYKSGQAPRWIINISDINSQRPLKNYSAYCAAKAGLNMLTQSLAIDLAPHVRVNAILPGTVLWPEGSNEKSMQEQSQYVGKIPLKRQGSPQDIIQTAWFLSQQQQITGQCIAVDGGYSLLQG